MKTFESPTLEEAYELASSEYECSITNLTIKIIQQPSKGFLGFFKKNAIISATSKKKSKHPKTKTVPPKYKKEIDIKELSKKFKNKDISYKGHKTKETTNTPSKAVRKEKIFDNFYTQQEEAHTHEITVNIENEIKEKVNKLFSYSCFTIDEIEVTILDERNIYVVFDGPDSALLIGKEGYRYKAISYLLFNWIQDSYGLTLKLEISEFLKNQEESISRYIDSIVDIIDDMGTYKTKPLDGLLLHIALKKLRDVFPNKYVAIKTNIKTGEKYILVNEYRSYR